MRLVAIHRLVPCLLEELAQDRHVAHAQGKARSLLLCGGVQPRSVGSLEAIGLGVPYSTVSFETATCLHLPLFSIDAAERVT
jgi:hypothetical protein